jgi:hypothetical protein
MAARVGHRDHRFLEVLCAHLHTGQEPHWRKRVVVAERKARQTKKAHVMMMGARTRMQGQQRKPEEMRMQERRYWKRGQRMKRKNPD